MFLVALCCGIKLQKLGGLMKNSIRRPKSCRKPTVLKSAPYPRFEVKDGRIYLQNGKGCKVTKVPLKRAEKILDRLDRAIDHVKSL